LAHFLEGHQRRAGGQEHQHAIDRAQEHTHLRVVLAREQIVVDVEPVAAQVDIGGDVQRRDGGPADETDDGDQ
jgi:hypothetical protein